MPVPEAAVPPFASTLVGDYEQARVVLQSGLDQLYKSVNILALQTSETGGGESEVTQADIDALQLQIDAINVQITAILIQISQINTGQVSWLVYQDAARPSLIGDNAGMPYRVRDVGIPERHEIIVELRNGGGYFYHVFSQTFQ